MILGAGGASRAISVECALAGVSNLTIVNRTIEKANAIAAIVNSNTSCRAKTLEWAPAMAIPKCDILINATVVGLYPDPNCPDIDYSSIPSDTIVQDIIPNPADTLFLKKAREMGCKTFDGLGMLVEQGAIAFEGWTGKEAPVDVMYKALASEM